MLKFLVDLLGFYDIRFGIGCGLVVVFISFFKKCEGGIVGVVEIFLDFVISLGFLEFER